MGVPIDRPSRWGTPVSLLVHVLLILLVVSPIMATRRIDLTPQGAGGVGPAGGGGGGTRGSGGGDHVREHLRFVRVVPAPPAPRVPAPTRPPAAPPKVKPRLIEPKPEPLPTLPLPTVNVKVDEPTLPTTSALGPGAGGGTGNDGTAGTGPGTGGGVGTGVGSGRGSANGPGTGGGEGTIYPATPDFLLMPSLPVPRHVRGRTLVLRFSIDERGRILKVEFESSGDGGYDKQLRQRFSEYRFRPAHRWDGTPVPSVYTAQLTL